MAMGCTVGVNRHGNLYLRIYFAGVESWEGRFGLKDTPENRRALGARAAVIAAEIAAGTFDYLKWFPNGNKAHLFRAGRAAPRPVTIAEYFAEWRKDKIPPFVKKSRAEKYASHFRLYILPADGAKLMQRYGFAEIRELRALLVEKKRLSMKTAKNVVNATLRAFFRDAKAEGVVEKNPFDDVPKKWWPKTVADDPDPFTEEERDRILDYFRRRHGAAWRAGYAFLLTLFWSGARPSELTARRWRDYDARTGKLSIRSSRTLGEEGATKTARSRRTIKLFAPVREELETIKPLRVAPDDYIFTSRRGRPIDNRHFGDRDFQAALRALGLAHRDFYSTRATFISVMLTHGASVKWVGEYVATSAEMIEKSYGKYIGASEDFIARALAAVTSPVTWKQAESKPEKIEQESLVRGRGFEPLRHFWH